MKKVFSFLILLILTTGASWCCDLKREMVSLSAPITGLLEQLKLLESPQLKAISLFHPVKDFKKDKLGGGLFLAQKVIERYKDHLIYYDESRELAERLAMIKDKREVRTRSQNPFVITRLSVEKLKENLVACEERIQELLNWVDAEEKWHQAQISLGKSFFFLGILSSDRWPEYIIVQDGFVLSWIEQKKIETFQSDLAYVRWGEKWKKTLTTERLVGLAEARDPKIEKIDGKTFNFYFPGALTPGIYQIKFMRYLRENWP